MQRSTDIPALPVSMFVFAWTGQASVSPVVPIIALVLFMSSIFTVYLAAWIYLADCYERHASSAIAAQSWLRNVSPWNNVPRARKLTRGYYLRSFWAERSPCLRQLRMVHTLAKVAFARHPVS